jgi:hypothetical protein
MPRKLVWCYALLLVGLIGLGCQLVRSGIQLYYPDQNGVPSFVVCYSCNGWSDQKVFEFGAVIFAALLLFRILRWAKTIHPMEPIVALLLWLCVGFLLWEMDVRSIILTIRLGNFLLLTWMACYLALVLVVIALISVVSGKSNDPRISRKASSPETPGK